MSKKYKLLKDLPDSKAGDVYVLCDDDKEWPPVYYKNGDQEESYWLQKDVENNPDWFEEIKDETKSNDSFQDAHEFLIRKGVKSLGETFTAFQIEQWFNEFAQSHTPKPQAEKDVVIKMVGEHKGRVYNYESGNIKAGYNKFDGRKLDKLKIEVILTDQVDFLNLMDLLEVHKHCFPRPQAENKLKTFPEAKAELDRLNPRPRYRVPDEIKEAAMQNKPDRDWQIECFTGMGANYWRQRNGGYHSQPFQGDIELEHFLDHPEVYKIYSVKRLTDNEVFTVNEITDGGNKIYSFELTSNTLSVHMRTAYEPKKGWLTNIQSLVKKQKRHWMGPPFVPYEKIKLFTTEDGVDKFKGDNCYDVDTKKDEWIANHWYNLPSPLCLFKDEDGKEYEDISGFKFFHTAEAAEKYIAENKPQPQKEEQRIEVVEFAQTSSGVFEGNAPTPSFPFAKYIFTTKGDYIPYDKFELIKKAIENILNS